MDDTHNKQAYLRQEVVDRGYDTGDFVDFLAAQKPNGQNIDSWTLAELKQEVTKFQEIFRKKYEMVEETKGSWEKPDESCVSSTMHGMAQTLFQKESMLSPVTYDKFGLTQRQLNKKIKCIQWKPFVPEDLSATKVHLEKAEVKSSGGIFGIGGVNQIWYTFKTSLTQSQIKRQDEDFEWLRKVLHRFYPAYIIPPLRRTKQIAAEDTKSLDKRMVMIKLFLEALAKSPVLFNTKLIFNFLTINDYSKYLRFKQEANSISFLRILSNLQTEEGTVSLEISNRNQKYIKAVTNYTSQASSKFNSMKQESRAVARSLDEATANLYKLANNFADVQKLASQLSNAIPELEMRPLAEIFISVNNSLIELGKNMQSQKKIIDRHLSYLFKYSKQENDSVKDVLRHRAQAEEEYVKTKANLEKKKEKVYTDSSKWEIPQNILSRIPQIAKMSKEELMSIILPKETDRLSKLREWSAYLNKNFEVQFGLLINKMADRFKNVFDSLARELGDSVKQQLNIVKHLHT